MLFRRSIVVGLALCALLVVSSSGCMGLAANLLNAGLGNCVPARYEGLAKQRVAVICVSQSSSFGPSSAADQIAETVTKLLQENVPDIEIVPRQELVDWMDRHDWNQIDYREIGQGVGAQKVVAIDLHSFSLYEGKTLFKGRSDIEVSVYDLTQGEKMAYHEELPTIEWPVTGGRHVADTSEPAFRKHFIGLIGNLAARHFFPYDPGEDFGRDTTLMGM